MPEQFFESRDRDRDFDRDEYEQRLRNVEDFLEGRDDKHVHNTPYVRETDGDPANPSLRVGIEVGEAPDPMAPRRERGINRISAHEFSDYEEVTVGGAKTYRRKKR